MHLQDYELNGVNDWSSFIYVRVFSNPPEGVQVGEHVKGTTNHIPVGDVFVKDPEFGENALWKLPAGHNKESDMSAEDPPLATAIRELEGETGIRSPKSAFRYIGKWLKKGWVDKRSGSIHPAHWKILFVVNISEADRDWMNDQSEENEGEQPKFFKFEEFRDIVLAQKFMIAHLNMLKEKELIYMPSILASLETVSG